MMSIRRKFSKKFFFKKIAQRQSYIMLIRSIKGSSGVLPVVDFFIYIGELFRKC